MRISIVDAMTLPNGKERLYVEVDPEVFKTIEAVKEATGLKKFQIIEAMVRNTRLDLDGVPRGWDLSNPQNMNQVLPYAEAG